MLEDLEVCDLQGVDGDQCVFVINDYAVPEDEHERQKLMQQKLTGYAEAISNGSIGNTTIPRRNYRIELNCSYDPGDLYAAWPNVEVRDEYGKSIAIPVLIKVNPKPPLWD